MLSTLTLLTCPPFPFPVQVGPRMSFSTAFSSNAVSICASCGLEKVTRVEVSRRFVLNGSAPVSAEQATKFASLVSHPQAAAAAPEPDDDDDDEDEGTMMMKMMILMVMVMKGPAH